jgi:uncharacterized protein DUF2066
MTETQQNTIMSMLARVSAIICVLILWTNSPVQADSLFAVRGISVDKTAASASEARVLALAEGQKRAFSALLRKLTPKTYHPDLPVLDDAEIASMVTGVQVMSEKTSAKRYLADLTVEFKGNRVLPILQARRIPYSESISKPILVLPVFDNEGQKNLWDEPNPWRDAWIEVFDGKKGPEGSLQRQDDWAQSRVLPIQVPAGTLDDMKLVTVDDAVYLREEQIRAIADTYGAGAVLVAYASLQNQNGIRRLDISYQRSDLLMPAVVETFTGGDTDRDIFRAAIFDVVTNLQESWKDQNILNRDVQNKLAVSTSIENLQSWLKIKEKVTRIPAIELVTVREMSIKSVYWEISFLGDLSQLRNALAQQNLILKDDDGYWSLNERTPN